MIAVDVKIARGDFSLEIAFDSASKITALFGHSGSGKTTLIELISGLARPDSGRIEVAGRVLVDTAKKVFIPARKRGIGLVFQDAQLFPHFSVAQNLRFAAFFAPKDARKLPFARVVDTLGIGHLMKRRPAQLSGGERQRVGVARALMSAPRLLLMDEPFASIDVSRRTKAMELVERARDEFDTPVVLVSHQIEEVMRLAGTVVMIERGRVVEVGAPEDIFATAREDTPADRFGVGASLACGAADFDARYRLTRLHHPAGDIFIPDRIPPARETRVFIKSVDVTLARRPPPDTSIRTILRGKVASIATGKGPLAMASIELDGGEKLFCALTRMAVDDLGLVPGAEVFCLVKAVALDERQVETV
ncbi:molybdenum ABC transporter ATP-binding protein [Rhodoblastus sphagnicola]|uniref:Molybdenum ABC transporter ATP-binding protein n=1 Tax=Rhodoblastus sphagnicola TaxID=333368 RepID=A0A2S6N7W9_9HYPH|nr:molybdenum ABC transporter ATP-binding protein [Rhodoblastus sphagnicola]MBB4197823.1 molybdate transport system ATP-binding protein [Rhodoblastus sphagnicola]PPQ30713.1 molybdenum ABC transporter ATP-binding protein [Rhodoblastus sphagnicola]